MIVRLGIDGAVVHDADDCARLHVETDLDADGLRTALAATGTGEPVDDAALLDLAVLRSRAAIAATVPDWAERWAALVTHLTNAGRVSADGRSVRVNVVR